ncbi:hypothetical protein AMS68_000485 [Peltaster fructicola]|uniref:EH domain-containing protein n=1 Tax=Peltaster fructicola TaxID=286661 RepID=A0A6H0XK10_9PEZI|nr:hypothetical protein AMS68_000485 [Peltaster fructicola]
MEVGSAGRPPPSKQQDAGHRKAEVGLLAQVESGDNASQQHLSSTDISGNTTSRATTGGREEGGQVHKVRNTTESKDFAPGGETGPVTAPTQDHAVEPPRLLRTSPTGPSPTNNLRPQRAQTSPIDIRPRPNPISSYDNVSTSGQSTQSLSATYRQLYPKKTTPLTTDNELANAIVASSLATSRISTSQPREPPPVPTSRRHSRHIFYSRTPSPVKAGLRQTLRKQESSDSDEEDASHPFGKHQKKRLIRKHPNKHHEGDRKRWRDAVTETERKRYEGVWAANKGLFIIPMPKDSDSRVDSDVLNEQVCNVVVKDIWTRSRLPDFELEAVWDLVDTDSIGRLSKEEFVVGMWLIDQRLKGRKLPVKVQPTVWASVRGIKGIKIRKQ